MTDVGSERGAVDAARDTLGGALAAAQQLPERLAGALVDAAQGAFTQGLHLTVATGAVIALALAVIVVTLLREVRTGPQPEDDAGIELVGSREGTALPAPAET